MRRDIDVKKEKIRNIISLVLIVVFAIVFVTGIVMIPSALRTRTPIEMLHTISGILMGLLTIIHIVLELRHKMQQKRLFAKNIGNSTTKVQS
ncbi:MAG: DUF4405 domain-containing protein [Candidatus Asgardarchaeia archaeon]